MKSLTKAIVSAAALAALAAIASSPALAGGNPTFNFVGVGSNSEVVKISTDGGSTWIDAYAGQYKGNFNGGQTFNVFCVDPTHDIQIGDSYTANTNYTITDAPGTLSQGYYNGGLGSELTSGNVQTNVVLTAGAQQARSAEVAWLADNYLNATSFSNAIDTVSNDNFTAVSLSIWNILMDGGGSLGSGLFQAQTSPTMDSLVGYYESHAANETGYSSSTANWIQAPVSSNGSHMQSYVYCTPVNASAVPEPSPITVIGIGALIIFGAVVYRRRRTSAPIAA